ncbi:MAG: Dyp-type peroxidase [Nostocoides sp.]
MGRRTANPTGLTEPGHSGTSRRSWLTANLAVGTASLAACTSSEATDSTAGSSASSPDLDSRAGQTYAFFGQRQPGVAQPPQAFASWVGFDLVKGADRDAVRRLMVVWSDDIPRLMAGTGPLTDQEPELAAVAAGLTATVGWGPGLFSAARLTKPSWLHPLPAYDIDRLQPAYGQTDVIVQVCADSPVTLAHARRQLITGVSDLAAVRWIQSGFREPMITHPDNRRMRNLFGQVDGTVNPDPSKAEDAALIWTSGTDTWPAGGTSLVLRRIAMNMSTWDQADRESRENAIGRRLDTGGPVTGGAESAVADLNATDSLGFHVIDDVAHIRRAAAEKPNERILRRPYNYDDTGQIEDHPVGLLFAAYQKDPMAQFAPIQERLSKGDLLNLWTTPIGSAVYAVPPGCRDGEYLGQPLLT